MANIGMGTSGIERWVKSSDIIDPCVGKKYWSVGTDRNPATRRVGKAFPPFLDDLPNDLLENARAWTYQRKLQKELKKYSKLKDNSKDPLREIDPEDNIPTGKRKIKIIKKG